MVTNHCDGVELWFRMSIELSLSLARMRVVVCLDELATEVAVWLMLLVLPNSAGYDFSYVFVHRSGVV